MIDYNIEFKKGVIFVRLSGTLNNDNYMDMQDELFEIIKDGGIKYLVFNNKDLDIEEDTLLFENMEKLINDNDGKMLLCGNEMYMNNFNYVDDELSALKSLQLC